MDMALANAAAAGHERVVEILLKKGVPPSGKSEVGQLSPLHGAASKGHLSTVKLLLQHGATPAVSCPRCLRFLSDDLRNEDSEKALKKVTGGSCKCPSDMSEAASEGDFENFRQMLDQGVDVLSKDEGGCTALHWAARNGHESIICLLLEMHPEIDLSAQNYRKQTVLHLAAVCGHEKIVSLLLESVPGIGLAQDMENFTALHLAALKGHDSVVRVLLSKDPNTDHSKVNSHRQIALHLAASESHATTVKLLLDNGYGINPLAKDINEYTVLGWAVQGGHEEVVRFLLHKTEAESMNWQGGNLLHLAARNGHTRITSLLIQQTPGLFVQNANGMTPLHIAAMKSHGEMVCLLLESVTESEFSMKDGNGYTALHWAVQEGHNQTVHLLLQRECKIDFSAMITAGWQTALHIPVLKGHEQITRLLLEKIPSSDLAIRNMRGYTALHLAASWGHETIVRLLVERCLGAYLLAEEGHRYTALHLAAIKGHEGMVKLLLQKSPKVDISVLTTSESGEVIDDTEPSKGHEVMAGLLIDSESVNNSCGSTAQKLVTLKRRFAADNEKRRGRKVSAPQSVSDAYA